MIAGTQSRDRDPHEGADLGSGELIAAGSGASRHERGPTVALCEGEPAFIDADLARLAREQGTAAAWLELHARAGTRAPERVHGSFACAIVDRRERTAFLAVDRFGIDTLCYALVAGGLAFASRADAVLPQSRDIDAQALFDYLYFHVIPAPRTLRPGVLRLLPGHCAVFADGRLELRRYWQPVFEERTARSFESLREEFLSLAEAAVAQATGPEPTGAFLSGGTDSSTVAGMLSRSATGPVRTYSIGFDEPGYDEMEYARITARHFGTDHHEHYVSPAELVEHIGNVVAEMDQPFGNSSVLPAYSCARMARADGVERLLAGDGGDELFGGNTRYAKQRVFEAYGLMPPAVRRFGVEGPFAAAPFLRTWPGLRKVASYVEQARVPMPDRMQMYNLLQRVGVEAMLEPDFLAVVDLREPARQQRTWYGAQGADSLINRMLAFDWKYALADNDLPKVTSAARAAGVVTAFPLLDQRLVNFSLGLPPAMKLKGLQLRWFFKEALRGFLPAATLTKKKHGFGLPFGPWAVRPGPLRDFALDSLAAFARRGYVRPDFIRTLVERDLPAYPGYYGELVWILMMLEQWLARSAPAPRSEPA